jgi:hypothetical protein
MQDGQTNAFVGNEGIVGVGVHAATSPHRVVRAARATLSAWGRVLLEELNRSGAMQSLLLGYTQGLLTQISQTIACHRHHSIISTLLLAAIQPRPLALERCGLP